MVGAQQPAAPQAPPKPADQVDQARPQSDAKTQTITGCVQRGSGADSFVLAESGAAAAPAPGDKAAPGAKPAGTTGATKSYALMAKPSEDLSKHVNHRIEVTGIVSAAPSSAASAPNAPKEVLNVQSIKMVAASCQ
jgi:hypothetical protein